MLYIYIDLFLIILYYCTVHHIMRSLDKDKLECRSGKGELKSNIFLVFIVSKAVAQHMEKGQ